MKSYGMKSAGRNPPEEIRIIPENQPEKGV